MEPTVLVAVLALIGVLGTGGMALIGQIGNRRAEQVRDSNARPERDVARQAAVIDDLESQNGRLMQQRDSSTEALGNALVRVGMVEAYARQLEDQLGLPHRIWTERLDTVPEQHQPELGGA